MIPTTTLSLASFVEEEEEALDFVISVVFAVANNRGQRKFV